MLTSELVTNAVLHSPGEVSMRIRRHGRSLMVEVFDGGAVPVQKERDTDSPAESGRGLTLVRMLADSWGIRMAADRVGKSVWFQFRVREPHQI